MTDIDDLLAKRGAIYGDYRNIAFTAQELKRVMRGGDAYGGLTAVERESLDMIANKLSRIVNGKRHRDNWDDTAGYAQLASEVGA